MYSLHPCKATILRGRSSVAVSLLVVRLDTLPRNDQVARQMSDNTAKPYSSAGARVPEEPGVSVNSYPGSHYEKFPGYYKYNPLPRGWIRLIRCVNAKWESPSPLEWWTRDLEIQLLEVPFEEAPAYDAISYTWGAATQQEEKWDSQQILSREPRLYPVRCDGKIVLVTKTLRQVLGLMWRLQLSDMEELCVSQWERAKSVWCCK